MLPSSDDCDECRPPGSTPATTAVALSSLPFIATFLLVSTIVLQKLFPILSGYASPNSKKINFNISPTRLTIQNFSALTSSTTIALAAVLAELILCEISGYIDPNVRRLAFHFTIALLLIILVIVIPSLQIHSVISAAGWDFTGKSRGRGRLRLAWVLQFISTAAWLVGFWWTGEQLLAKASSTPASAVEGSRSSSQTLSEACLSRVGIIGISFMALLSGFASVSAPWQTFFSRHRPVTEADVARKAAGLEATDDMLAAKRSRLRALERKIADSPQNKAGFFQKAMGSIIRGNADLAEVKALEMEIGGLETMASSLSASHNMLATRRRQQNRSRTFTGRLLFLCSYAFSLFCLYRILTTFYSTLRRALTTTTPQNSQDPSTTSSTSSSDPIPTLFALLIPRLNNHHNHHHLSFLLSSGLTLLASFTSALQTFALCARFLPAVLRAVNDNLPLLVAQVCGIYTLAAALLLRGKVVRETRGGG
ncbi:MAG: hypothetical protein Q9194_006962, partial [Teloschistes cf. exilis]